MSLYSKYVTERTNKQILETEYGFATYNFPDATTVYIEDIYVLPEHRKSGLAAAIANEIVVIAKEKGCTQILGSVVPTANNSTDSLKVLLAYGMKLRNCSNDFIVFQKDII